MDEMKKRIENIKYWYRWIAVSAVFFVIGIVLGKFPDLLDSLVGLFQKAGDAGTLIAFVLFGIAPAFSFVFLILGLITLYNVQVRCEKCGKIISFKDLKNMDNDFLCPYCLNDSYQKPVQDKMDHSYAITRTLVRILRRIFK